MPEELAGLIAERAGGDARNALNILELAWDTAVSAGEPLSASHIEDAARKRPLVYDKGGDAHYDFISAFIKSMRASDPDAAVYYLVAMLEGGEDARYIARRMIVHASEDVGLADPRALLVAVAAAQAVEHVGLPEARLNLTEAAIYIARAPKSNAVPEGARRGDERRPRARSPATAGRAARRPLRRREEARPRARATSTRTTTRPASRSTTCPTSSRAGATTSPPRTGKRG